MFLLRAAFRCYISEFSSPQLKDSSLKWCNYDHIDGMCVTHERDIRASPVFVFLAPVHTSLQGAAGLEVFRYGVRHRGCGLC